MFIDLVRPPKGAGEEGGKEDGVDTIEDKMTKFNRIHERIKHKAFGKVTIGKKDKVQDTSEDDHEETEEDRAKILF